MKDLYERQMRFQERYVEWRKAQGLPVDPTSLAREYILSAHREASELLDTIPQWKPHRSLAIPDDLIRSNLIEEGVDVIKFVLATFAAFNVTYEEYRDEFEVKTEVVEDRWQQEHEQPVLDKVVLIDLDGVLNHYPVPFFDFIERQSGVRYTDYAELRDGSPEVFRRFKHLYRQSGIKRVLPAKDDSLWACTLLAQAGYQLVIMSQRPSSKYSRIYGDTIHWLRSHGVQYSRLMFVEDKQDRLLFAEMRERIVFAVDDDPNVVDKLRDLGIKTYQLGGATGQLQQVSTMMQIPEVQESAQRLKQIMKGS